MTNSGRAAGHSSLVRAAILGLLGSRGPSSRAEIARALGVSPATVTQTAKDLLARGLITELASVPSQGGRPAVLMGLVRDGGGALGVKVTADHVAIVVVGLDGTVQSSKSVGFDSAAADAVDRLIALLADAVSSHDGHLLGIGIGIPGQVDAPESGIVEAATLGWDEVNLGTRVRAALDLPVLLDNDVNTLAMAESLFGIGRSHSDYLVVTIGRGTGCGVVLDGVVMRGAHGGAGELGHLPVSEDGPTCGCGNVGCLEAHIGEPGLIQAARESGAIGPRGSLVNLARAAAADDSKAAKVYADAGHLLGRALAGVVNVLDPEVVVITGEGVSRWSQWNAGFEPAFRRFLIPSRRQTPYVVEEWSDDQWARGAACLVLAAPFDARAAGAQGDLVRQRLQTPTVAP